MTLPFEIPKRIKLKGKSMEALRNQVYDRDGGKCVRCGRDLIRERGHWWSMQLAHKVGKGAGGDDTPENTESACIQCHIGIEHSWGKSGEKPCPRKN